MAALITGTGPAVRHAHEGQGEVKSSSSEYMRQVAGEEISKGINKADTGASHSCSSPPIRGRV